MKGSRDYRQLAEALKILSIMTDSFAGVFLIGMIEAWSFIYPHLSLEKKKTSSNY